MINNKKGFTLIELLAVIVILAIIALITVPTVLNIIDDAKKGAAADSTHGINEASRLYYSASLLDNMGNFDGYECSFLDGNGCENIGLKGTKPTAGTLSIGSNGAINGKLMFGEYIYFICNSEVVETETSDCNYIDYTLIYEIDSNGIITGFKEEEITSILEIIIPSVKAGTLTTEAQKYMETGIITIPEYVGNVEVTGVAPNAFNAYNITEITFLSRRTLTLGNNALPSSLVKIKALEGYTEQFESLGVPVEEIKETVVSNEPSGPAVPVLYKETILNGAVPELYTGLIPVIIESNGIVKVADTYTEWYNYDDKRWANAVTVNNATYRTAPAGTEIPESAISIYYVWIPRYRYLLWNANNEGKPEQEITVIFENNETTKSTGSTNGTYLTHPAFTFGSKELNGIWVSKFEATGTITSVTSKPNLSPIISKKISVMFTATRDMEKIYNTYGFISESGTLNSDGTYTTKNGIDIHMMKNMEWGAAAYLTQSKYGKCTDGVCREVGINNYYNSVKRTGCGNAAGLAQSKTCNSYINALGSTTGNITGIYDMSGGAWEYVMGNMKNSSGNFYSSSAGFSSVPNSKFYNSYAYGSSSKTHARGMLGDTTKEALKTFGSISGGWYSDSTYFTYNSDSWFTRGGGYYNDSEAGLFYYGRNNGASSADHSFRFVLTTE